MSPLGQALSCLKIMGEEERQRETQIDRGTDGGGGGEELRDREEEGKQGIRAGEQPGTSETYQTHTEVRSGGRRCRGGRRRGREQGERNRAETEGEEIDESKIKQRWSFEKTGQEMKSKMGR